eukprot:m.166723 g.166723  ORF g.166723 m.166723 type:complete len:114 (+) comp12728_c0_seq1:308-649(+)
MSNGADYGSPCFMSTTISMSPRVDSYSQRRSPTPVLRSPLSESHTNAPYSSSSPTATRQCNGGRGGSKVPTIRSRHTYDDAFPTRSNGRRRPVARKLALDLDTISEEIEEASA